MSELTRGRVMEHLSANEKADFTNLHPKDQAEAQAEAQFEVDLCRMALKSIDQQQGWRPIEDAPKDGSYVWVWGEVCRSVEGPDWAGEKDKFIARWNGYYFATRYTTNPNHSVRDCTHFQHLPKPPEVR